jgi:transposase-like protein
MGNEQELGTGRRPRRFRTVSEKRRIAELTFEPGASVALVARAHGVNANQVFMGRAGVNQHTATSISGHKTPSMFRRFNIQSEDDLRNAMERTQAKLEANTELQKKSVVIRQAAGGIG